jgi:uncharacterized repeat protein (TIGR01451 family)
MTAAKSNLGLPSWWRYTLVALATLILCSCQALPPAINQAGPLGGETAMDQSQHVITDGPEPWSPSTIKAVEVRELDAELLKASRPLDADAGARLSMTTCSDCPGGGGGCELCTDRALVGPPDEYLCDGGDFGLPAAVRADWTVDGLEQEDAIAHYDTLDDRVIVTPSNRVCVYAPRFAAVRRVESLLAHERRQLADLAIEATAPTTSGESQPVATSTQRHAVAINLGERPPNLFRSRQQPAEMLNLVQPGEFYNTLGPYANLEIIRTGQLDGSEQALVKRSVQAAVAWNGDQAAQVVFSNKQAVAVVGLKQPGIVYQTDEPGNPRLRLLKLASTHHALPGEEVEFTLRFDSIGDQVIGNVTIVDNLTTRLEYVPNSAKCTVPADFSAVPNGAGSTVLRWEIKDPVEPGEGGVLQFKCRVK